MIMHTLCTATIRCVHLETYFDIRVKTFSELLFHTLPLGLWAKKKNQQFHWTYKDDVDDFNKRVAYI